MKKTFVLITMVSLLVGCRTHEGLEQVGVEGNGQLMPTYQALHPAGESVEFNGRPVDLALSRDSKSVYVKDNRGLIVIDVKSWTIRQELKFPSGGGSPHGIEVALNGSVWATTSGNLLCEALPGAEGLLSWKRQIALPGPGGSGSSFPGGFALARDGKRAYVALSRNNSLAIVDLESGKVIREIAVGVAPFDVVLNADESTVFVSNWGGRRSIPGDRTAKLLGNRDCRGRTHRGGQRNRFNS